MGLVLHHPARAFRLYVKKTGEMIYPEHTQQYPLLSSSAGELMQLRNGGLVRFKPEEIVVLYATGMQTTQAKDIWDGDIVDVDIQTDVDNGFGSFSAVQGRALVRWEPEGSRWVYDTPLFNSIGGPVIPHAVVGNIYQNLDVWQKVMDQYSEGQKKKK